MKKFLFAAFALAVVSVSGAAAMAEEFDNDGCIDGRRAMIRCEKWHRPSHDGCEGPEYMVKCNPSGPRIEPGHGISVDEHGQELVDVLGKNLDAFTKYSKAGNKTISAKIIRLAPQQTRYELINRACFEGGINRGRCLGGSRLIIEKKVTPGNMPKTEYRSKIDLLR